VAKHEGKVLVLFEDGKLEIERTARDIAERIEGRGREVSVLAASGVGISDILAAELYVLGAASPGSEAFSELARVFKGANLAGRGLACFGSSGAAVAWLKSLCADTELAAAHVDFTGRPEPAAIAAWLKGVLTSA
jgi:hypothetical protein